LSPIYSGMGFSVIGAVLIEKLRAVYTGYQELGIPIILSGGGGLSVIFISIANGVNNDLVYYFFCLCCVLCIICYLSYCWCFCFCCVITCCMHTISRTRYSYHIKWRGRVKCYFHFTCQWI